jgi:methylated-DNA-[protein]-cysteine S-methyltransferase
MSHALVDTPLGPIGLSWEGETLTQVDLEPDTGRVEAGATPPEAFRRQLTQYFKDGCGTFDLPLVLQGTEFQRRVWSLLRAIPAGETRTYGALARELGSAPRAVGQACRANPLPIVVPCHRVVGAQGLGGFAGDTSGRRLAVKRWLLRHEGVPIQ